MTHGDLHSLSQRQTGRIVVEVHLGDGFWGLLLDGGQCGVRCWEPRSLHICAVLSITFLVVDFADEVRDAFCAGDLDGLGLATSWWSQVRLKLRR